MDKTKAIAVAVVAIIVVAAAAVVLMNDGDKNSKIDIDSELLVFGNADRDYTVDSEDLKIIEDVLKEDEATKETKLAENPLLDANYDGKLTQADADLVKKIIDGKPCTVYHYNASNYDPYVVSTKWPVKSALATATSNSMLLMTLAGINKNIHGISYSGAPDPLLFPHYSNMDSIGSSSTTMPIDNASTYIDKYSVTAIITDKTESTVDKATIEPRYESMGVDIVRLNAAAVEPELYCQQLFLLGFLFQTIDECEDVAEWWVNLLDSIENKLKGKDKVSAFTCNSALSKNGVWISAGTSDYVKVLTYAGAEYALDDKILTNYTSGTYFKEGDTWLYNYDFDYIISIRTGGWYPGTVDDHQKYFESLDVFKETKAYQEGNAYVITGDSPIPVRVAYAAAVMYPDYFSFEWADQINQEFFDKFTDSGLDLTGLHFYISYDMAYPDEA